MASSINPITSSNAASSSAASASSGAASAGNSLSTPGESVFLNLLVSQIQNQDPLNPTDSTQFVSQLAQFSELEQVIGIRSDIESQMASANAAAGTTGGTGTTNAATTPATTANVIPFAATGPASTGQSQA